MYIKNKESISKSLRNVGCSIVIGVTSQPTT